MFEGFEAQFVLAEELSLFVRTRGHGPPVLLLHGFPETHLMWHAIAPALSENHTVVCADLRGSGSSDKPRSNPEHEPYSKRAMARDFAALMTEMGYPRFAVVGHDRGGRVAYRLALDYPDRIERIAVLDVVPAVETFRRSDARMLLEFWPWSLMAQSELLSERMISANPAVIVQHALTHWGSDPRSFSPELRRAYIAALAEPRAARAVCEEFRAAFSIDVAHDEQDCLAGRKIHCPMLALWSEGGALDTGFAAQGGPLAVWANWASDVKGQAMRGGHFFPEANSAETLAALERFLGTPRTYDGHPSSQRPAAPAGLA